MRRTFGLASALALALIPAGGAYGSSHPVDVGETKATNEACSAAQNNLVQAGSGAGRNSYAMPYSGVLTSWSHDARQVPGAQLKLKVFRPQGGNRFMTVGESGFHDVGEAKTHTFPVRIPVQAGDVLGLGLADNRDDPDNQPASCFFRDAVGGDVMRERVGDLPPGQSGDFNDGGAQVRASVSARLEAAPSGSPFTPLADSRKPTGKVSRATGSSLLTNGLVALTVTPDEDGNLAGGATINVPKLSKVYRFKRVSKAVRAGVKTRVRLKLSKKGLRAARRAARRRKKLKVRVSLTLADRAGNKTAVKRTIAVKRKRRR